MNPTAIQIAPVYYRLWRQDECEPITVLRNMTRDQFPFALAFWRDGWEFINDALLVIKFKTNREPTRYNNFFPNHIGRLVYGKESATFLLFKDFNTLNKNWADWETKDVQMIMLSQALQFAVHTMSTRVIQKTITT